MTMNKQCDLLVVGSGAAGLACAITAKKRGLDVVVIEKEPVFGGTTALSGGVLWIPLNHHGRQQNPQDTVAAVRTYMMEETGSYFDEAAVSTFIEEGPKMVDFFERNTEMQFIPTLYPDYHPDKPGGAAIGRSILAQPFDIRRLGADMARLKPPLKTITFMGMMFNSSNADLKHLTEVSRFIYETANMNLRSGQPFVGSSAFAHKGGMHVHAVQRIFESYEHIEPERVGNTRRILLSELAGRSNVLALGQGKYELSQDQATRILNRIQDLEHEGYQFEAAGASFDLLARRELGLYEPFFEAISYRVNVEFDGRDSDSVTEATLKIKIGNHVEHVVGEGDGPVNALDAALRKAGTKPNGSGLKIWVTSVCTRFSTNPRTLKKWIIIIN